MRKGLLVCACACWALMILLSQPALTQRGNIDYDQIRSAARRGTTGTLFQMAGAGATTAGDVLVYDAGGNAIDGGALGGVAEKTGNYTATSADGGKLLAMNCASACTLTLPVIPPSARWFISVESIGPGALTVDPNGLHLDTLAATMALGTNQGIVIYTDGTDYFTQQGVAAASIALATHKFLTSYDRSTGIFTSAQPIDADISFSDITTGNASTSAHGFLRKLPNDATVFLDGTGAFSKPNAVKSCVVVIGDPGAASPALADDNDSPVACGNTYGSDMTVTSVSCWANAGSPSVTPILTGGTGTSILTGALTCGTASWAAGTLNGSPVVHSFSANGATCSATPCTVDVNITTAGGTAKYLVVRITGSL